MRRGQRIEVLGSVLLDSLPVDTPLALLPFEVSDLPDQLAVSLWNGGDAPSGDVLDRVEFYVMPYVFSEESVGIMSRMPNLSVTQTLTAGYEHVLPGLPKGVVLCNAKGVHDASTAELAIALTLASLRRIPELVEAQQLEEWAYDRFDALADKTVLILGFGSIGGAVAERLEGFECDIVKVARTARGDILGMDDLHSVLEGADVVILTLPLTEATAKLVDRRFLARMKSGAILVNVSRGGVVDTDALVAETSSGRLRAGLDVTDPEPLPEGHPLWRSSGVLITPHVGGNTTAFMPRAISLVRSQLLRFTGGEVLANVVVDRED